MESFHEYPRSLGGVALLLLRVSVGILLFWCVHAGRPNVTPSLLTIAALVICVGLILGILTSFLGAVALIGGVILLCMAPTYLSLVSVATLLLSGAIALLGAGAYSLDGILFGRRRIIV